ncbi:MAG: class I SAM-dependent methyltransferase [Chitinophagales bacterium]|nr:class I SAM-dependent methyltransferase [Chitinophagales bacterium]
MNNLKELNLGNVQKTLLLPLAARVFESKQKNSILHDPKSVEIANQLKFDYLKICREMTDVGVAALVVRAVKFDEHIRRFQQQHPYGKIITLGAGLDTSYYRCDNGLNQWYDLDLEDSLELRKELLPIENDRIHYLAKSLFDPSWIDDIGDISNGTLIQVPGVLPYFPKKDVKSFFQSVAPRLKGAELVVDVVSAFGILFVQRKIHQSGMKDAHLQWSIFDAKEMETWSEHIKVAETELYFKGIHTSGRYHLFTKIPMMVNDIFGISQIVKIKFV